jgi:hypothetical protein
MICPELIRNRPAARVDLYRFGRLHREGRRLISGWFERAWQARECSPEDSFEPLIFAWFAFNGWAACVTGLDQDRAYLDALMCCPEVTEHFQAAVNSPDSGLAQHASNFASLWPIFDVHALRRRGIQTWHARHLGPHRTSSPRARLFVTRCYSLPAAVLGSPSTGRRAASAGLASHAVCALPCRLQPLPRRERCSFRNGSGRSRFCATDASSLRSSHKILRTVVGLRANRPSSRAKSSLIC